MDVPALLSTLEQRGIHLTVEGNRLRYRAPAGAPIDDWRDVLRARKTEIIAHLTANRRPRPDVVPLSYAQERMWFLHQLEPGSASYHMAAALSLRGPVEVGRVEQALRGIVARHEALRTTFVAEAGLPRQRVHEAVELEFQRTDLRGAPAAEQARRVEATACAAAQRPFDLERGPLLRAHCLQLAEHEHVLLLTLHHIVSDGWSTGIMMREFAQLYRALGADPAAPLPALPLQYADFALWQREWLSGERLRGQLAYWRTQLQGLEPLELPTDYPRPPVQTDVGATFPLALPAALLSRLKELARAENATLFMTVAAGLKALLSRYTSQTDIAIGAPIANRTREETEPLIGLFVNTIVLRTSLADNPTFAELLRREREVALAAYAHQDVPFEQVVHDLQPQRDLSRSPLFQVMLAMQPAPPDSLRIDQLEVELLKQPTRTAKFDLLFALEERPDALDGYIEYNRDLFAPASIERLATHFVTLCEALARDPHQRVGFVDFLPPAEKHRLLLDWNATSQPYPSRCLHHLFEDQAAKSPHAPAVLFHHSSLSYQQLDHQANQLARHLIQLGVAPECTVPIFLERSLELVVGLLAILKAGGAYLPLDPDLPAQRLQRILREVSPRIVLTQARFQSVLPPLECPVLALDRSLAWAGEPVSNPGVHVTGKNLAYVIYTSGSTGQPKAAMNVHEGIHNRLEWMQREYRLTADDAVLQKTPYTFDVSVWEFFWPLMAGARLVLAQPGGHRDPAYLARLIVRERITTLHFVPSLFAAFLREPTIRDCISVRRVICSGEALPASLVTQFHSLLRAGLHNLYGPTEASVDVTYHPCEGADGGMTVPIGRPIANTRVYILDRQLQLAPTGAPGEIYLAGIGLARGYAGHPELTADRFVPDGVSGAVGERLYRTGDLGRYRSDGVIEFLGRIDHQVKLRGIRIELGEIEAILRRHSQVADCAVIVREDNPGDQRLVAYVVPASEATTTKAALAEHLSQELPEYLIPNAFVFLPALPLTTSGKLSRRDLPAPALEAAPTTALPATATERAIAQIWCDVLRVGAVGRLDNFFQRGGHSLLAIQAVAAMRARLGVDFPLRRFFAAPTLDRIAEGVDQLVAGKVTEPSHRPFSGLHFSPLGKTPSLRVICFPPAGGGPHLYLPWNELVGPSVEIVAAERPSAIPGDPREVQTSYIEAVVGALAAADPIPFAFFGHSLGAMLAFHIASALAQRGLPGPVHLYLSARPPGRLQSNNTAGDWPREIVGADPTLLATLADPAFAALVREQYQADSRLNATLGVTPPQRVGCPITAIVGRDDPYVTPDDMATWSSHTSGSFRQVTLPGDHYYLRTQAQDLVRLVSSSATTTPTDLATADRGIAGAPSFSYETHRPIPQL